MTLREKLELAGYRLRSLAAHMPTEWQRQTALSWADDAVRASGIETEGHDGATRHGAKHESPTAEGGDAQDSGCE